MVNPFSQMPSRRFFRMKMLAACGLSAIAATLATQQAQAVPTDAMLAPPPAVGSPLDKADHEIFEETRALKGTRGWTLATQDTDLKPAALLKDFSCAAVASGASARGAPVFCVLD